MSPDDKRCNLHKSLLGIETAALESGNKVGKSCNLHKSLLGIETASIGNMDIVAGVATYTNPY